MTLFSLHVIRLDLVDVFLRKPEAKFLLWDVFPECFAAGWEEGGVRRPHPQKHDPRRAEGALLSVWRGGECVASLQRARVSTLVCPAAASFLHLLNSSLLCIVQRSLRLRDLLQHGGRLRRHRQRQQAPQAGWAAVRHLLWRKTAVLQFWLLWPGWDASCVRSICRPESRLETQTSLSCHVIQV